MNKKAIILLFNLFLCLLLHSQTYRCAGQYLEAHPFKCDLFVVTNENNEPSAILMSQPCLSHNFCIKLDQLKDTTSNLIIADFLIAADSIDRIMVNLDKILYQDSCGMVEASKEIDLRNRWIEELNRHHFKLIYGRVEDLPQSIKMVFYFDSGHKRDYPDSDGALRLSRNEYTRRRVLLENCLNKANITIPNLVWPHFD